MQSLLKVALLSLMLIAVSRGPVPAGTGSQPERPYSVAQPYSVKQMGKPAGTVPALPKSQTRATLFGGAIGGERLFHAWSDLLRVWQAELLLLQPLSVLLDGYRPAMLRPDRQGPWDA